MPCCIIGGTVRPETTRAKARYNFLRACRPSAGAATTLGHWPMMQHHRLLLAWLLGCALAQCGSSTKGEEETASGRRLEYVSLADHPEARCLDGSPAGYYLRRGRDANNRHDGGWVVYLEDGGFCFSEAQCREQSHTAQGSSATWPPSREDPGGIMSKEAVEDPGAAPCSGPPSYRARCSSMTFANLHLRAARASPRGKHFFLLWWDLHPVTDMAHWNKVLLPSCDGSAFTSNRTTPLEGAGGVVFLRGASIFQAFVSDLLSTFTIRGRLLLAGSGSGGLGVMVHLDGLAVRIKAALPDFKGDVIGLSDSAFIPLSVAGGRTHAVPLFAAAHSLWQPVLPLNGCGGDAEGWECLFAEKITQYLKTPLYSVQAAHDCVHMQMCLLPPGDLASLPPLPGSNASEPAGSQLVQVGRWTDLEAIKESWETAVREAIAPVLRSKRHGVYINSCPARLQLLMNCGLAPERGEAGKLKSSDLLVPSIPGGSDAPLGGGVLACSDCGGWRKHWVRVGCQLINVREAFGDWYFSYYWKGGDAEYAKVLDRARGGQNPSCRYIQEQRRPPSLADEMLEAEAEEVRQVDNVAFNSDEL